MYAKEGWQLASRRSGRRVDDRGKGRIKMNWRRSNRSQQKVETHDASKSVQETPDSCYISPAVPLAQRLALRATRPMLPPPLDILAWQQLSSRASEKPIDWLPKAFEQLSPAFFYAPLLVCESRRTHAVLLPLACCKLHHFRLRWPHSGLFPSWLSPASHVMRWAVRSTSSQSFRFSIFLVVVSICGVPQNLLLRVESMMPLQNLIPSPLQSIAAM